MSPVYAIRETAKGVFLLLRQSRRMHAIAWSVPRGGAYAGDADLNMVMWFTFSAGTGVTRLDAIRRAPYQQRLGGGTSAFTASPVAAGRKIYIPNEEGDVFVVRAGRAFSFCHQQTRRHRHGDARNSEA
jgi:hypothetical protein